jgi:hypothetical protein
MHLLSYIQITEDVPCRSRLIRPMRRRREIKIGDRWKDCENTPANLLFGTHPAVLRYIVCDTDSVVK